MTQHNLSDLIPSKRFAERYIPRSVPGTEMNDLEVLRLALTSSDKYDDPYNVMMTGPTGPGKTSAVMALCAIDEIPCATVNLNGMTTVEDLVGQLVPTEGTQDAEITQAIDRVAQARHASLVARETKDAQAYLAANLEQTHAELQLDRLYHEIVDEVKVLMAADGANVERGLRIVFAAHYLERVGDRMTNIAEDVVFLATGHTEDLNA